MNSVCNLLTLLGIDLHESIIFAIEAVFLGQEYSLEDSHSLIVIFASYEFLPVGEVQKVVSVSQMLSNEIKLSNVVFDHVKTGQGNSVSLGNAGSKLIQKLE